MSSIMFTDWCKGLSSRSQCEMENLAREAVVLRREYPEKYDNDYDAFCALAVGRMSNECFMALPRALKDAIIRQNGSCGMCVYFYDRIHEGRNDSGHCCRNSPQQHHGAATFPVVNNSDVCHAFVPCMIPYAEDNFLIDKCGNLL